MKATTVQESATSDNRGEVGQLHAYASGSGSLSFVVRDEHNNLVAGRRPQAQECIAYIKDKLAIGQGSWAEWHDWMIVNQGPLEREDHEHCEAVQKVERIAANKLLFRGKEYTYDPNQDIGNRPTTFVVDTNGVQVEVEGSSNWGALSYFLRNEKALTDPARVVWDSKQERVAMIAALIPAYSTGQQFEFKNGDQIVGNGFRGTVRERYSGEIGKPGGMVNVRLPGGIACLSASYPDCYPANVNGIEVVTDGQYLGRVEAVTDQFVVQSVGRGKLVAHEAGKFTALPQVGNNVHQVEKANALPRVGEIINVQYKGSRAVVLDAKAQEKGNER